MHMKMYSVHTYSVYVLCSILTFNILSNQIYIFLLLLCRLADVICGNNMSIVLLNTKTRRLHLQILHLWNWF